MNQTASPIPPSPAAGQTAETTCPSCGASNRAGTRFCASCGAGLTAQAPPPPPVPPIAPPHGRFGYGAAGFGQMATDTNLDVGLPPDQAFLHAERVLAAMNADIVSATPATSLSAILPHKGFGKPLRFRTQINLQPAGPGRSRVSYGVKIDWNSAFMVMAIVGGLGVFNILFMTAAIGILAPLCSVVAFGWLIFDYQSGIPAKIGRQLGQRLSAAPQQSQPQPGPQYTPQPAPTPAPFSRPQGQAGETEADIIAKIEKLAALHEKGLLSSEEFDKRRGELLDRL